MFPLWSEPKFQGIALLTQALIMVVAVLYYFLKRQNPQFRSSWSSVLSWALVTPFMFVVFSMAWPYPLAFFTVVAIYGCKVFFQMTGMYHRNWFVVTAYAALIGCSVSIYYEKIELFNSIPALYFLVVCLIPMARDNYKQMVQYMALSLMAFFLLWLFLHLGLILEMPGGVYTTIYLILLTELFENTYLRASRKFKRWKLIPRITPKRTMEGYAIGAALTLGAAWLFKDLLEQPQLWWALGSACFLFGSTGNTVMTVIRRDLGIKVYESFVIGRGDFFTRIERLVFVAPASYYVLHLLGA